MHYTLTDHPLHQAIYDLCQEVEKLLPSEHATKLVVMAGALQQPVAQLRADLGAAREDTARLDWLEQQVHKGFYNHTTGRTELTAWSCHDVKTNGIRASIDAARAGVAGK